MQSYTKLHAFLKEINLDLVPVRQVLVSYGFFIGVGQRVVMIRKHRAENLFPKPYSTFSGTATLTGTTIAFATRFTSCVTPIPSL